MAHILILPGDERLYDKRKRPPDNKSLCGKATNGFTTDSAGSRTDNAASRRCLPERPHVHGCGKAINERDSARHLTKFQADLAVLDY